MLRFARGQHSVIPNSPCFISHIGCGGEHPPDFTAMGLTECEAMPAPAWEGRQGAEATLVSRGTTVPLSPANTTFPPSGSRQATHTTSFLTSQTSAYTRKYQPVHLLGWSAPCVTFRLVVAPLRGPGRSPVLPFACCVGSMSSVGRCGRCSCWCRFRVRGPPPPAHAAGVGVQD